MNQTLLCLSTLAQEVLGILRQKGPDTSRHRQDEGMHKYALVGRLSTPTCMVETAIGELVERGYICAIGDTDRYTTKGMKG